MTKQLKISYLYRCRRCGQKTRRGSAARYCDRVHYSGVFICRGALERLCTIAGPVTDPVPTLKVTG